MEVAAPDALVDAAETPARRRLPVWAGVALVVVVIAVVAGGAGVRSWSRGGTYLRASGPWMGAPNPIGVEYSVGIMLQTESGPSVVLDRVSSTPMPGAEVRWSVVHAKPKAVGFGSLRGPLGADWPTQPVHGYRVAQPRGSTADGSDYLIATVTATRPGMYRLDDVKVTYHSGAHTRTANTNTLVCVLAYPEGQGERLIEEWQSLDPSGTGLDLVDPRVAQFARCSGTLAPDA